MFLVIKGEDLLGVIFTGGEGPPVPVIQKVLVGKNAFLTAADSGLITAEDAGFKPDLIIGDMDSVPFERLKKYPSGSVMRFNHDKDYTDTELALQEVIKKGCDKIWIIGGGGGRIDHLFGIRSLFERDIFPHRWITDTADIYCLDAGGEENVLSLKLEKKTCVSVFPLGDGPWKAASSGLKWQLMGLSWERGFFGLSNITTEGLFSIKAEEGRFMVIVPLKICI
jgi:thiamine pyrophosphokinase